MWLVLFVLSRIDWVNGIGQVLASVGMYVQVGISRDKWNGWERGKCEGGHFKDTWRHSCDALTLRSCLIRIIIEGPNWR